MNNFNIYKDIAERTNGDIYVGVVGPVRTGKSMFITKFMENLVIPNIVNKFSKERAIDELPQSAEGKTIMTTQPKFVPSEAVNINLDNAGRLISDNKIANIIVNGKKIKILITLIINVFFKAVKTLGSTKNLTMCSAVNG